MKDDVAFLAAMLDLAPKGHATASEYERLERLAEPYLAVRFGASDADLPDDAAKDRKPKPVQRCWRRHRWIFERTGYEVCVRCGRSRRVSV